MMLLSNRLTYCITTFIVLLAFGFVMTSPVLAHPPGANVAAHDHPLNEQTTQDLNDDGDIDNAGIEGADGDEQIDPHNGHPIPVISSGDDASTVTDGKDGNRIRIVEVADDDTTTGDGMDENENSRTFTVMVDFSQTVVGVSTLRAIDFDNQDPPVETTDSVPDLDFTTILLDKNGATITGTSITDGAIADASITAARVADSNSQFIITIVLPVEAVPDGNSANSTSDPDGLTTTDITATAAPNLEEITLRIRVNQTAQGESSVYSLATIPDFTQVPGGASFQSNLLELTLVGDVLGTDPAPTNAVVSEIKAGAINEDAEVVFTITFDKALLASQSFRLGDIDSIAGGRAVDFDAQADGKTFLLTVEADDPTQPITVTIGDKSATSDPEEEEITAELDINVVPPDAPTADGKLVFTITSTVDIDPDFTINDFDIDTAEVDSLASGDLVKTADADLPDGIAEQYTLTLTPKSGVTVVLLELRAGARTYDHDGDGSDVDGTDLTAPIPTPGVEARYSPETTKPAIAITAANNDDSGLAANAGQIDSVDGGTITIVASDSIGLASGAEVVAGEVTIENGSMMAGSFTKGAEATFTVIPNLGATSVKVTVAANAVADGAGNGNAAKSETFSVGPIFEIPANTIMVIHKTMGITHEYLSDQPRLPINQQPPTPAAAIATDIWHNMPDLEVLFSRTGGSNGGTLNVIEAHGQADITTQTKYGNKQEKDSVRVSEVMWAVDLSLRGGVNDAEAGEQWIEVSNDTGDDVSVFLYARTGLDSAINIDGGALDRVGNAYNGGVGSAGWNITSDDSGKGQNGNSYTGVDFVSMHRKYTGGDNRGYVNGTSTDNWSASGREYLTEETGNPNDGELYNYVGSPGRRDSINLPTPNTRAGVTAIPGSSVGDNEKVVINEVANRSDARYEWIELYNNGSAVADLRNFRVSMVTATGTERELFRFAHNDAARIPVGGVLLVVATDPRYDDDHPIAVGHNVAKGNSDQVAGLGLQVDGSPRAPARYRVRNFQHGGLPDDGKFVLIVRSPDDTENKNEGGKGWAELNENDLDKITDIAGWTDVSLNKKNYPTTNPTGLNETNLWPLVNFGAPNVVKNKLEVNRVHFRRNVDPGDRSGTGTSHGDQKDDQVAWNDAGYSGIGYKRTARNLIEHRGTPGYHNNTVNNKANSSVTISEVMYSTGANGTLPQWIELYNSSATKAVHLGSGWRIRIETLDASGNALSNLLTVHFGSKGRVKYIYPQQTVLVAAGNAKQAGGHALSANIVFPENRLFNVYRDIGAGELKSGDEFKNDQYMFFNPKAFYLGLLDKDGAVVDEIGNLDGDSRTNDTVTPDEEFPSAVSEDGVRSSIIRIYDNGVARTGSNVVPIAVIGEGMRTDHDGIDPDYAWIPAVNTGTVELTWYGDRYEYGTPGHRRGLVLPVQLSFFRPTLEDGVVTVRWTTESELDNAGFNIYRSETRDGEYKQVNTELIDGAGTTGERSNYSWVDQTAKPGVVYYYQIEDVSFAGDREALAVTKLKGLISAKNKLTTTWSELKEASQ